jgi:TPR repeat protein
MQGDTTSMVELGEMYLKGECVERDVKRMNYVFERAHENEDLIGTVCKADCLLTGTGTEKDFNEGYTISNIDRSSANGQIR